jgi:hypothetical protein
MDGSDHSRFRLLASSTGERRASPNRQTPSAMSADAISALNFHGHAQL